MIREQLAQLREKIVSLFQPVIRFTRDNRTVLLAGVAGLSILLIVWARLGFSFEISRFFASGGPSVELIGYTNMPTGYQHGDVVDVSWSAKGAVQCVASSWINTQYLDEGRAQSAPIDACNAPNGAFEISCLYADGHSEKTRVSFLINMSTCPTNGGGQVTPTETPTTGGTFDGFCNYPSDVNRTECACAYGSNRTNQCHVCTPSWKEGNTDYSDAQWQAWDNEGMCRPACPDTRFPYLTSRLKGDGSAYTVPEGCVEKPDDCPGDLVLVGSGPSAKCVSSTSGGGTVVPTGTPAVTISTAPTTLVGQGVGTIAGSATDPVRVSTVRIVLRSNPKADGSCNTNSQDWNGSAWVTGCQVAGQMAASVTPGPSVQWSITNTPSAAQLTPGTYMIFAGAWRDAYGSQPWSGYVTKTFTYTNAAATATPTATIAPTATPTPTISPTPVGTLSCSPPASAIRGQQVVVMATGGSGEYAWTADEENGDPVTIQASGNTATMIFSTTGAKTVNVRSAGLEAQCVVNVQTGITGNYVTLAVAGRNISRDSMESQTVTVGLNQTVEVVARIRNLLPTAVTTVRVRTAVPAGLVYIPNSTTVNGAGAPDIEQGFDVNIGSQQESVVRFRLRVAATTFGSGALSVQVPFGLTGEAIELNGAVTLLHEGSGTSAGGVKTGPGDALIVAFLVSILVTTLYVSYTRSSAFAKREASRIADAHDPMDFRN